jgi:hypothetical protein
MAVLTVILSILLKSGFKHYHLSKVHAIFLQKPKCWVFTHPNYLIPLKVIFFGKIFSLRDPEKGDGRKCVIF